MFLRNGYFTALPEIETARLILRRIAMDDVADLFEVSRDPRVARFVLWRRHTTQGDSRSFIRSVNRSYRADDPAPWGIILRGEHKLVGTIGFTDVCRENETAEVGYSLGYAYWNQGIATEALCAVLREGFTGLGFHRIEAQHDVRNPASGRVMAKAGMRLEGRLKDRLVCKGEYVTVDLYAAIVKEWKGPRA